MQGNVKEIIEFLSMREEFQIIAFVFIAKNTVLYGEMEVIKHFFDKNFSKVHKIMADVKDIILTSIKFELFQ